MSKFDATALVTEGFAVQVPDSDPPMYTLTPSGVIMEQRVLLLVFLDDIHTTIASLHEYIDGVRLAVNAIVDNLPFDSDGMRTQTKPQTPPTPAGEDRGYL